MYYTYAYLREDRTPYYIGKGKGKGRRIFEKRGRPCGIPVDKTKIIFLKQNLTEQEAFNHEKYMIFVYGRKDLKTGILHNKTNGGDGVSGYEYTQEQKLKMSKSKLGKKLSLKHRKNISKGHHNVNGENHPMYGKPAWNRDKKLPVETTSKMSEAKLGRKWWNNGLQNKFVVECPGTEWRCGRLKTNQSKGH
jgi:hypothetical protein